MQVFVLALLVLIFWPMVIQSTTRSELLKKELGNGLID
jgi:hypothetical protein